MENPGSVTACIVRGAIFAFMLFIIFTLLDLFGLGVGSSIFTNFQNAALAGIIYAVITWVIERFKNR